MAIDAVSRTVPQANSPEVKLLQKYCSLHVLMGVLLIVADAGLMLRRFRLEPDTWWHIKFGQDILATGQFSKTDFYSFTAYGNYHLSFEWLGEIVLALAYRIGHLQALQALLFLLTSIIVLLLYYFAYLRCGSTKAAFVGSVLVLPVAAMCFSLRPQLIGYIFLLITLICLERYRQGQGKSLWVLPPVFLVWVNTHGSFALGLFVFALYWASGLVEFSCGGLYAERWRQEQRIHLALIFLLNVIVLPLTPFGGSAAVFPIEKALYFPALGAEIIEWRPLPFNLWQPKLLLILLFAFLVAQIAFRQRYRLEELALFLFAAYAACTHSRFAILWALVTAPLIGSILANWARPYRSELDKYVLNAALVLAAVAGIFSYFPSERSLHEKTLKEYPVQAVEYLNQNPVAGPMFNSYNFGGYLIWAMGPAHKVFIDGRGDFYEYAGVFSDYANIMHLKPETRTLLRVYHIQSCLIENDTPLATFLAAQPNWKQVYKDELSVIFVRQSES